MSGIATKLINEFLDAEDEPEVLLLDVTRPKPKEKEEAEVEEIHSAHFTF